MSANEMPELLPCPFCGSHARIASETAPQPEAATPTAPASGRVKVPDGQTPLNDKLSHPLLDVFNEGIAARDNGTGSPYHGHSLEHCLHAAGWVQRDLRLALDATKAATQTAQEAVPVVSLDALIDLIGEFGREVYYLLDDCETSGPVGEEVHTITDGGLRRVSAILDRIDALPFEEPGVILGTGAMLQAALRQTFNAHQPQPSVSVAEALKELLQAVCGETGFAACVRQDSGRAYPWPALDAAEAKARAALKGSE